MAKPPEKIVIQFDVDAFEQLIDDATDKLTTERRGQNPITVTLSFEKDPFNVIGCEIMPGWIAEELRRRYQLAHWIDIAIYRYPNEHYCNQKCWYTIELYHKTPAPKTNPTMTEHRRII